MNSYSQGKPDVRLPSTRQTIEQSLVSSFGCCVTANLPMSWMCSHILISTMSKIVETFNSENTWCCIFCSHTLTGGTVSLQTTRLLHVQKTWLYSWKVKDNHCQPVHVLRHIFDIAGVNSFMLWKNHNSGRRRLFLLYMIEELVKPFLRAMQLWVTFSSVSSGSSASGTKRKCVKCIRITTMHACGKCREPVCVCAPWKSDLCKVFTQWYLVLTAVTARVFLTGFIY